MRNNNPVSVTERSGLSTVSRRILLQEPWSYVLFEEDGDYVVTFVVAGTTAGARKGDFSVRLNAAEKEMQQRDRSYVERLVKRLGDNPVQLAARRLQQAVWPETAY